MSIEDKIIIALTTGIGIFCATLYIMYVARPFS